MKRQRKRRSKKRKKNENRQPTAMKYSRYSENMMCLMADYNLSRTAILTYLYINLNCNLSSGISHQTDYQQIEGYFGWHTQTRCWSSFLSIPRRIGIPASRAAAGMRYAEWRRPVSRVPLAVSSRPIPVQTTLRKRFVDGRHLTEGMILRVYDELVAERIKEKRWRQK